MKLYILNTYNIIIPNDIIDVICMFYGVLSKTYSTSTDIVPGNGQGVDYDGNGWKEIETLKNKSIIKIATGWRHSLFLESNGNLYCSGYNGYGQLGINEENKSIKLKPIIINHFKLNNIKIINISCGYDHNLSIDINNKVYSWGLNNEGQCGIFNLKLKDIYIPSLISTIKHIKSDKIRCGAYHSYVGTVDNKHYLFGSNHYNECMKNDEMNVKIPYLINKYIYQKTLGKTIKSVYPGFYSTIFILTE